MRFRGEVISLFGQVLQIHDLRIQLGFNSFFPSHYTQCRANSPPWNDSVQLGPQSEIESLESPGDQW